MSVDQVNYLNIGLMILATGLAFILPFELFLFSYAVLGPLHYLTEISWLHKRNYFTNGNKDYLWLVGLCILYMGVYFFIGAQNPDTFMYKWFGKPDSGLVHKLKPWGNHLVYIAFMSSLGMILLKKWNHKILFFLGVTVSALFLNKLGSYPIVIGVFLPTLFHVFVFTGAFILYGALKGKSFSGITSLVVFILCSISFFLINYNLNYVPSQSASNNLIASGFHKLNGQIIQLLQKPDSLTYDMVFSSKLGIMIQRFIAFAYTYHYLNWFSKTSVIKWHKVPKSWLAVSGLTWIASIGLYFYDYKIGFISLLFLSMLHVLLEFPLNYRTFVGIGQETMVIFSRKPRPARVRK